MSIPFGAHQPPPGQPPGVSTSTTSYFGKTGDEQESPTSNPFAFVGAATTSLAAPGQGVQQNFNNPFSGNPPNPNLPPVFDTSGTVSGGVTDGQWFTSEMQHTPSPQAPLSFSTRPLSHQHSLGTLNVTPNSSISGNQAGELEEDPFSAYTFPPPRSKSSQAQRETTQMKDPFSGSSSAPATGLVSTTNIEQDRNFLDPTHTLFQQHSLPSSSSGSSIERPPLSPHLPPPVNAITNATLSSCQPGHLPVVHSYPHLPVNATNADGDVGNTVQSSVPLYHTNAVGYPTTPPLSMPVVTTAADFSLPQKSYTAPQVSEAVTNSQGKENLLEVLSTERDNLTVNRGKVHGVGLLEGDHSLSSSLNQSVSSLLESQEDITQHSPVQILPPAPETQSLPPPDTQMDPAASSHFVSSGISQHQTEPSNETEMATKEVEASPEVTQMLPYVAQLSSGTQPHVPQPHVPPPQGHLPFQPSVPGFVPSSHPVPSSHIPSQPLPQFQTTSSFNPTQPTIPSNLQAHTVNVTSLPLSSGAVQAEEVGVPFPTVTTNQLPLVAEAERRVSQQTTIERDPQVASVTISAAQTQERTNAQLPITSQNVASTVEHQPSYPGVSSGGNLSVQSSHQQQPTSQAVSPHVPPNTQHISSQAGPPSNKSDEGTSTYISTDSTNNSSLAQKVPLVHSVSNPPPLLPPPAQHIREPLQLQSAVLSNAHILSQTQPSVPYAHPLSQPHSILSNAQPPPSDSMGFPGILSNAHLSQNIPPVAVGVQPPPPTTTTASTHSDVKGGSLVHCQDSPQEVSSFSIGNSAVAQLPQSEHVTAAATADSTTSVPHSIQSSQPQSVPLNQAPVKTKIPSTPDSVFSPTTAAASLIAATTISGIPTNAGTQYQAMLYSDAPSTHPTVHLTATQTSVQDASTVSLPGAFTTHSNVKISTSQVEPLRVHPGLPTPQPGSVIVTARIPTTQQPPFSTNPVAVNVSLPSAYSQPLVTTAPTVTSVGGPAQPAVPSVSAEAATLKASALHQGREVSSMQQQHVHPNPVSTSAPLHQPHSVASTQSSFGPPSSGPTRSIVTAPVTVRDKRDAPPSSTPQRRTGEQLVQPQSSAHQGPPPQSSSSPQHPHHRRAEHPPPPSHPSHEHSSRTAVGEDGRLWRHTTELRDIRHPRDRERYDHYYAEDPYRYERGGHYAYEDPYYDYYRERPGSRAPYVDRHSYYPEEYDHDPYGYDRLYHRRHKEYDPYTGHYYYIDDPYVFADPRAYDQYSRDLHVVGGYDEVYGPLPPLPRGQQPRLREQGGGPQGYTQEEHTQSYPPSQHGTGAGSHETTATTYPDQSTIYGAHDVFEEGGTFVDSSPSVRGGQVAHRRTQQLPYAEDTHSEYSRYGIEPPMQQPLWGSAVEAPVEEPMEPPAILRRTPELFAHPHVRARFGPGGSLVVVLPHNLRAFQRAEVELLHVTQLIGNTEHAKFVGAVSEFPGPLMPGETPKAVAVSYASSQAEQCRMRQQTEEGEEGDAEMVKELHDEALLWDFLMLLCQQNGVVVASDISELLTREKLTAIPSQTHVGSGGQEDALVSIRQLLIAGRKRDALELACRQCLWGHALMLASKMDEQSRTYVINRFTASLVTMDPLSTFYTLMLGRTPSAVKPEGLRRAGSWRPHLAMILANRSNKLDNTSIVTLGDSLLESGRLCAAHFCYHMADEQFGTYGNSTSKYLLLGVENSRLGMGVFPRPEYLRKMEVFEYAMSLGKQEFVLPHFQLFKYLLALQLTQIGMISEAFKYCEQIAVFVSRSPGKFSPALLHVVDELSTQLHHLNHPHGIVETELPSWLLQLQQTASDILAGNYASSSRTTPSPAFSSVSQTYMPNAGQNNGQSAFGQGGSQYLKVPGGSYKGSSVDTSTAASSKEGSVVGGVPTQVPGTAALNAEHDSYQPSPLLQQQQASEYATQPVEEVDTGHVAASALYSQTTTAPTSDEAAPVISDSSAAVTNSGVLYYAPVEGQGLYNDYYPATTPAVATSGGEMNSQPFQPPSSSEQYMNPVSDSGGYGGFGMASTALPDQQGQQSTQEQQAYAPSDDHQQQQFPQYPGMHGHENQLNSQQFPQHPGMQGYESQQNSQGAQPAEEQAQQFGYDQSQQQQKALESTQGHMYQQPGTHFPPPSSEPAYGGASYWDQQYLPQSSSGGQYEYNSGGGGDVNEGTAPASAGQSGNSSREEEEDKRNTKDEKTKGNCMLCEHCIVYMYLYMSMILQVPVS